MWIPRRTLGSRGLAMYRYKVLRAELGDDHPATRAAYGRLLFHRGCVPQRDALTPEAIAWRRESGAAPGFSNRHERKRAWQAALEDRRLWWLAVTAPVRGAA
jgi:hypothetical protein